MSAFHYPRRFDLDFIAGFLTARMPPISPAGRLIQSLNDAEAVIYDATHITEELLAACRRADIKARKESNDGNR